MMLRSRSTRRWGTVESVEELNECKVVPIRADRRLLTEPFETGTPCDLFKFVIERRGLSP